MSPIRYSSDEDPPEKKATEADALEIWTVISPSGKKALAVELAFDGKDFNFIHTFTTRKDAEDVIEALRLAMEDCWPTPSKQAN